MQRGLPRGSFEQNEVDEYHSDTGRARKAPGGARSNPPEAVDRGVPPKLARVEPVLVVAPRLPRDEQAGAPQPTDLQARPVFLLISIRSVNR